MRQIDLPVANRVNSICRGLWQIAGKSIWRGKSICHFLTNRFAVAIRFAGSKTDLPRRPGKSISPIDFAPHPPPLGGGQGSPAIFATGIHNEERRSTPPRERKNRNFLCNSITFPSRRGVHHLGFRDTGRDRTIRRTGRDARGRDDEGPLLEAENPAFLYIWNTFPSRRGVQHLGLGETDRDGTITRTGGTDGDRAPKAVPGNRKPCFLLHLDHFPKQAR